MRRIRARTSGRSAREYEVTFADDGTITSVCCVDLYGNLRTTWSIHSGKPMTVTAACAGRAAQRKLATEIWSQPQER
jgi:hypothetical protein